MKPSGEFALRLATALAALLLISVSCGDGGGGAPTTTPPPTSIPAPPPPEPTLPEPPTDCGAPWIVALHKGISGDVRSVEFALQGPYPGTAVRLLTPYDANNNHDSGASAGSAARLAAFVTAMEFGAEGSCLQQTWHFDWVHGDLEMEVVAPAADSILVRCDDLDCSVN